MTGAPLSLLRWRPSFDKLRMTRGVVVTAAVRPSFDKLRMTRGIVVTAAMRTSFDKLRMTGGVIVIVSPSNERRM